MSSLTTCSGSMFGTLEGVITSLHDLKLFPWMRKELLTACIVSIAATIGLIFVTRAGEYFVKLFDEFAGLLLIERRRRSMHTRSMNGRVQLVLQAPTDYYQWHFLRSLVSCMCMGMRGSFVSHSRSTITQILQRHRVDDW